MLQAQTFYSSLSTASVESIAKQQSEEALDEKDYFFVPNVPMKSASYV